jgi:hypothetical protein
MSSAPQERALYVKVLLLLSVLDSGRLLLLMQVTYDHDELHVS